MIVVDASILTDFLIGRPATLEALDAEFAGREHEPMHAPELIEPETLNAVRGLVRGGTISDRRATEALSDLAKARLIRYPHAPFRGRVWELRDVLTAYDATYLALAEALDDPVLLTGDGALAGQARKALGDDRVRQIA